jgi:hypothetical protein
MITISLSLDTSNDAFMDTEDGPVGIDAGIQVEVILTMIARDIAERLAAGDTGEKTKQLSDINGNYIGRAYISIEP